MQLRMTCLTKVVKWIKSIKEEYNDISPPPKCVTISEIIEEVHDVLIDRIVQMEDVAETLDMFTERVHHILHVIRDL